MDDNLGIILTEGQRLTTLINNLLDLEKIEAGKMEFHFQPMAIGGVLSKAVTATAPLFEGGRIQLTSTVPPDLPEVTGDPDKLLQVVINLISNAVKFTPEGTIHIEARHAKGTLIVSVSDPGIGIANRDQALVFNKFTQIGDSLTSKPKGTGLGLAISKEIIEHHGGTIWVESDPGKGSIFSFSLPVSARERPEQPGSDDHGQARAVYESGSHTSEGGINAEEDLDR